MPRAQLPVDYVSSLRNLDNTITIGVEYETRAKQSSAEKKIVSTEFAGIGLYHEVPKRFIKDEIFRFHGKITDLSQEFQGDGLWINFVNVNFDRV